MARSNSLLATLVVASLGLALPTGCAERGGRTKDSESKKKSKRAKVKDGKAAKNAKAATGAKTAVGAKRKAPKKAPAAPVGKSAQ